MPFAPMLRLGTLVFAPRSLAPGEAGRLPPLVAAGELREEAFGERAYRLLEFAAEMGAFVARAPLNRHAYERELASCVEWIADGIERGDLVAFEAHLPGSVRVPAGAGGVEIPETGAEQAARAPPEVREPQAPPIVIPPVAPVRKKLRIEAGAGRVGQDVAKPFDAAIELRVVECGYPVPGVQVEASVDGEAKGATTDKEGVVSFVVRDSPDAGDHDLILRIGLDEAGGKVGRYIIPAEQLKIEPSAETRHQRVLKVANAIEIRRATADPLARGFPEVDLCAQGAKEPRPPLLDAVDPATKQPALDAKHRWKRTGAFGEHAVLPEVALVGLTVDLDATVAIGSALRPLAPWRVLVRGGESVSVVSPDTLAFALNAEPAPGFSIRRSAQRGENGELVDEVIPDVPAPPEPPLPPPRLPYTAELKIHGNVADSDVEKPGGAYLRIVTAGDDALASIEPHVFEALPVTAQLWLMNETDGGSPLKVGENDVDLGRVKDGVAAIWEAAGIRVTFQPDRSEVRPAEPLNATGKFLEGRTRFAYLELVNAHFEPGTCNIYLVRDLSSGGGLTCPRRQYMRWHDEGQLVEKGKEDERLRGLHTGKSGIFIATRSSPATGYSRVPYPSARLQDAVTLDLAHELGHFLSLGHVGLAQRIDGDPPPMVKRLMYGALHPGYHERPAHDQTSLPFHGILIAPSCKEDIIGLCEVQCARAAVRQKKYVELWPVQAAPRAPA